MLKKIKAWRVAASKRENVELYRILHNQTIEDIAAILPQNKEEFLSIKGIGEKKFNKYGDEMLSIIKKCINEKRQNEAIKPEGAQEDKKKVYSVSDFLDLVNSSLRQMETAIKGEVSSVKFQNHLYFSLKDENDESVINCFMWAGDYEMCGIEIEEGMEIVIHGFPEVYKPFGKLSFKTSAVELVGEGALKKAYDELKKNLEKEGLFSKERKKMLPHYPRRIGLITSRDGAVINDFLNNIGRFGYKINFVDSRVEGIMAVKDLINAVKYFQNNPVDILVIVRGGGSLESLQAFNNEALIREVVDSPMPVICGIGHDKDIPLLSYAADKAVSTPSVVAREINKSWERAIDKLDYYENNIIRTYSELLKDARYNLENTSSQFRDFYQAIFERFEKCEQDIKKYFYQIEYNLRQKKEQLMKFPQIFGNYFNKLITDVKKIIDSYEKILSRNNPKRQLKLGYSIITKNGKVVKSASQVREGDALVSKLGKGKVKSEAKEIFNN